MLIRLIRNEPQGDAITGTLYVDSVRHEDGIHRYQLSMDTLENLQYAIPNGFYRLRMTYSPRFQEILPLLDNVFGYYSSGSESCRMVQNGSAVVQNGSAMVQNGSAVVQNGSAMVQNGVELSLSGKTMLNNTEREALNNIEQPPHNATPSAHRTGIRIHAGNTIAHTEGCILVGILPQPSPEGGGDGREICLCHSRRRLEELRTYLLNYLNMNPYEEIFIQLESPDPNPDADLACPYEQQQHIYESLRRAKGLRG